MFPLMLTPFEPPAEAAVSLSPSQQLITTTLMVQFGYSMTDSGHTGVTHTGATQ